MEQLSSFLGLNWRDIAKSVVMAGVGAVATAVYKAVEAGAFPTTLEQWKQIGLAGLSAAVLYLLKNFLTNSEDKFLKPEPKA